MIHFVGKLTKQFQRFCLRVTMKIWSKPHYFKIASTDEEKNKLYQLRYNIYYQKFGRQVSGLDHIQQMVRDDIDSLPNTIHFYRGDIDNPSIIMRCVVWEKNNIPPNVKSDFDLMRFSWIDDYSIVELGRLMANPDNMKPFDALKIISSSLCYLTKQYDLNVIVASCKPGLVLRYLLLGLTPYTIKLLNYPDGIEILLAALISKDYVKLSKTPLAYLTNISNAIDKRHFIDFFSEATCIQYDAQKIIVELNDYFEKNTSMRIVKSILKTCAKLGAYILKINQEIKLIHKNSKEQDIYFILSGSAYIKLADGRCIHITADNFIEDFSYLTPNKRRKHDIYCTKASLFVFKRSCLEKLAKFYPYKYTNLMHHIAQQLLRDRVVATHPCATKNVTLHQKSNETLPS
jgi:hypothetical protein